MQEKRGVLYVNKFSFGAIMAPSIKAQEFRFVSSLWRLVFTSQKQKRKNKPITTLDSRRRSRNRNRKNGNVPILPTPLDSDFGFSLGHKRSYDSDNDSIASENQPQVGVTEFSTISLMSLTIYFIDLRFWSLVQYNRFRVEERNALQLQ